MTIILIILGLLIFIGVLILFYGSITNILFSKPSNYLIGVPSKDYSELHLYNNDITELEHILHKSAVQGLEDYPLDAVCVIQYNEELMQYEAVFNLGEYYHTTNEFQSFNIRFRFGIDIEDLKDDESIEYLLRTYKVRYKKHEVRHEAIDD
jgi:hypothetical protein